MCSHEQDVMYVTVCLRFRMQNIMRQKGLDLFCFNLIDAAHKGGHGGPNHASCHEFQMWQMLRLARCPDTTDVVDMQMLHIYSISSGAGYAQIRSGSAAHMQPVVLHRPRATHRYVADQLHVCSNSSCISSWSASGYAQMRLAAHMQPLVWHQPRATHRYVATQLHSFIRI